MIKHYHVLFFIFLLNLIFGMSASSKGTEDITKIKYDFFMQRLEDSNIGVGERIAFIDSLVSNGYISPEKRYQLLKNKATLLFKAGNFSKAVESYEILLSDSDFKNNREDQFEFLYNLACSYKNVGRYDKGMELAYEIIMTDKDSELNRYNVEAYLVLCTINMRLNRPDLVKKNLDDAVSEIKRLNLKSDIESELWCKIHLGYSGLYVAQNEYDKAFKEIETARKFKVSPTMSLCMDMNLAIIYQLIDEPKLAVDLYQKILANPLKDSNKAIAVNNYATMLMDFRKYDEALSVCDSNIPLINELNLSHVLGHLYEIKAEILGRMSRYQEAYQYLKQSKSIEDSLFTDESEIHINELSEKFTKFQIARDKVNLEKTNRQKTVFIYILFFLIVFIGVIAFWLFRHARRHKVKNEALTGRIEESQDDLDTKNRELSNYALHLAQIDEALHCIAKEASDSSQTVSERMKKIQSIVKSLNLKNNGWDTFTIYFQQTNKDFFNNLYKRHPNLSNGEVRMCAFIIMNLRTKDIAQLTNRSVRTIESIKYNISKKINLPEGQTLTEYLRTLSTTRDQ